MSRREHGSAVSSWFEANYPRLVRFAIAVSGSPDAAEVLVQEAYVRVRRAGATLEGNLDAYVRRAIVNLSRSRHRRRAAEQRALSRHGPQGEALFMPERDDALWRAIAQLPNRQRAVLALRYYEDLTEAATAELLGISIGHVKKAASRGVARLRQALEGMDEDER